eukprot:gb/GECH01009953.1/.p1 GENE.gb/GECH01009953.1/~~gb/GECH01009953.1/.p1  ORF type:complete len:253 (+),score=27.53 gb/GECH01009953.1/:1-759(+)
MFLFGGDRNGVILNDLYKFNFETYSWSRISLSFTLNQRRNHSMVSWNRKLIIFGGEIETDILSNSFVTCDIDNHEAFVSVVKGENRETPCQRKNHSAVVYDSSMIIYGGIGYGEKNQFCVLSDIWFLDFENYPDCTWKRIGFDTEHVPRFGHNAIITEPGILFLGGSSSIGGWWFNSSEYDDVILLQFDMDNKCLSKISNQDVNNFREIFQSNQESNIPEPRSFNPCPVIYGDSLFYFGEPLKFESLKLDIT